MRTDKGLFEEVNALFVGVRERIDAEDNAGDCKGCGGSRRIGVGFGADFNSGGREVTWVGRLKGISIFFFGFGLRSSSRRKRKSSPYSCNSYS